MPDRLSDERLEQYIASLPEGWTSREVAEEVLDARERDRTSCQCVFENGTPIVECYYHDELRKEVERLKKGYRLYNHEPCPVCGEVTHQRGGVDA
jgi:hypothetical protein